MKHWRHLLVIGLLCLVTACSSDKDRDEDAIKARKEAEAKEAVASKKPLPICPQVAIVREIDDIHDYGNEKPAMDQLVSEARMESVEGSCVYQDKGVDIDFDVNFNAARGPRMGGERGSFPFFIAVVDPDQKILNKEPMSLEMYLPDDKDKKPVEKTEHLHVFIPFPKEKREDGPGYQVLLGFQMTHEQLDAVRGNSKALPQ